MGPSYWKKYDRVFKHFSFKRIYEKILGFAKKLGAPFTKKGTRGRKLKVSAGRISAAYTTFEMITYNSPFRDMEFGSELYLGTHIDHSTFGKNFEKIPYNYLTQLLSMTAMLLEKLLGEVELLIADSTGVHTKIFQECLLEGKETKRKKRFKLHTLISSHKKKGITYVCAGLATDMHTSDTEGARIMLNTQQTKSCTLLADRGYDYEGVYTKCEEKNIMANIKPQDRPSSRKSKNRKKYIKQYNLDLYKKGRGVVETIFGGLRNKGLLTTRLRKSETIKKQAILCLFRHNLYAILRIKAGQESPLLPN